MSTRNSIQIAPSTSASSLVAPSLAVLAEPPIRQVDGAMMDYFLIELVNTLRASSKVAIARSKALEKEMVEAGLIPTPPPPPPALPAKKEATARDSLVSLNSAGASGKHTEVDEEEEAVRTRLDAIGMHVGANFSERYECLIRSSMPMILTPPLLVCAEIEPCSPRPWMSSNSSAKIYGRHAGISKWITCERTTVYVCLPCCCLPD